ncbi:RagB/SusD family nutrient uptake outer membrane protein [Soonwooa purpurea]
MKNTYIFIIVLFGVLNIASSCEQMLEVDMPENQLSTSAVFENAQTAEAALAALYAGLWENSPLAGDASGKLLGVYTDDLAYYSQTSNNGIIELYQLAHSPTNIAIQNYWSAAYQQIYVANAIIKGIDETKNLPITVKNRIKGEALAIRSILFLYLQQVYGAIPYTISTDYMLNKNLTRTDAITVLNLLKNDLKESVNLLNDNYRNAERIYINKKTAELALAKILIMLSEWQQAEVVLKSIIQNPQYTFQNDLTKVFTKTSQHIIWQLKPKNTGDAVKEILTYYFTGSAPNNFALSDDLLNSFQPNDLRRDKWMASVTVGNNMWYRADKYKNRTSNTTEYSVVYRLEEVYLSLAEVLVKQNKLQEALPYVNATRLRASLMPLSIAISDNELMGEILAENRREFFTEMGHRFFDLKRNGKLKVLKDVKPNWKDKDGLWPVPQKEIQLNNNLNPQNNGY